ncbi:HAD family hydrolase [Bacillus sp. FSL W7-1360]
MKTYKLLAVNIDGVLVGPDEKIKRRTKDAMNYLKRKGVKIVLMTSKPYTYARKVAKALKMECMIIAHGGALISDTEKKEWFDRSLHIEVALDACHVLERFHGDIRLMYDDHAVASKDNQKQTLLARISLTSPGDYIVYPTTYVDSLYEQVLKEGKGPLNFTLRFENESDARYARDILAEEVGDLDIARTSEGSMMILGQGAAKGRALQWLLRRENIAAEESVVIGMGDDDLEVVEHAGLGVAMGNASPAVQQQASWVTRTAEEDGFAYMVHEVFRKQFSLSNRGAFTQKSERL